jgi:hypothetical protein
VIALLRGRLDCLLARHDYGTDEQTLKNVGADLLCSAAAATAAAAAAAEVEGVTSSWHVTLPSVLIGLFTEPGGYVGHNPADLPSVGVPGPAAGLLGGTLDPDMRAACCTY